MMKPKGASEISIQYWRIPTKGSHSFTLEYVLTPSLILLNRTLSSRVSNQCSSPCLKIPSAMSFALIAFPLSTQMITVPEKTTRIPHLTCALHVTRWKQTLVARSITCSSCHAEITTRLELAMNATWGTNKAISTHAWWSLRHLGKQLSWLRNTKDNLRANTRSSWSVKSARKLWEKMGIESATSAVKGGVTHVSTVN